MSRTVEIVESQKSPLSRKDSRKGVNTLSVTTGRLFYYCGFIALCLWQGSATTNFETILGLSESAFTYLMQVICVFCLVLKILMEPVDFKRGISVVIIAGLLMFSYFQCKINILLVTFAFIVFGKGISFRSLAKIALVIYIGLFLVTVTCALFAQNEGKIKRIREKE